MRDCASTARGQMDRLHFVLPQLEPYYGMEKAAGDLLLALKDEGARVSATVLSGGVPSELEAIDVEALGAGRSITRLPASIPRLRRALDRLDTRIPVIASGLWASVPTGLALVGSPRSYVAWEHSVLEPRVELDRRVKLLLRLMLSAPLRPQASIAVSEGVREALNRRAPSLRVDVIRNLLRDDFFIVGNRAARDGGVKVLATTGAFREYKNYPAAIECLSHLPDHYELEMVGDGPDRPRIERAVNRLGLAHRVRLRGRVDNVPELLARADVLVHPSLSETFGFGLIEAAQHGLPVVTLPSPSLPEVIPTYVPGAVAPSFDPQDMAKQVRAVVEMDEFPDASFEAAYRQRRTTFAPHVIAGRWLAFAESLLHHPPRR